MNQGLWRQSALLSGAGVAAQLLGGVNLLIIGLIYNQGTVGEYGVFSAYALLVSAAATLSYEFALPNLPEDEIGPLLGGIGVLTSGSALALLTAAQLADYPSATALALMSAALGWGRGLELLNIRDGRFLTLAAAKVTPHLLLGVYLLYVWGGARTESKALLTMVALSQLAAVIVQAAVSLREVRGLLRLGCGLALLKRERSHALYVMPSQLMNQGTYQLPVVAIDHLFGAQVAGQYFLVLRLCFAPLNIITAAVGRVFHNRLAALWRSGKPAQNAFLTGVKRRLWLLGALAGGTILLLYGPLVTLLLGDQWSLSGRFAQWLAPLFVVMVVAAPQSNVLLVTGAHTTLLASQVQYLLSAIVAIAVGLLIGDPLSLVAALSLLGTLRYVVLLAYIDRQLRRFRTEGPSVD